MAWRGVKMAVRRNIGRLKNAIEAGMRADAYADYGPESDYSLDLIKYYAGDWDYKDPYPNSFIMGFSRWGDTTKKVVKET